ncbi:MAG: hypothetical protein DHS20C18_42190 [Saprospiraceae bacterium]|nr:MAG: hypothetical protein DHS20C18_42190 [Saprospiraceae bacterium]
MRLVNILTLLFMMGSCKSVQKEDKTSDHGNYNYYIQYCFYNAECTDSLLYSMVVKDKKALLYEGKEENIYKREQIERVDLTNGDDELVINTFLKSLTVYNRCAGRRIGCSIDPFLMSLFFKGEPSKKIYKAKIEDEDIKLEGLEFLREYNFKYELDEIVLEANQILVDFGQGTKLYCTETFYKDYLFPYCLNFISKKHRLTGKNIEVKKTQLEKQE